MIRPFSGIAISAARTSLARQVTCPFTCQPLTRPNGHDRNGQPILPDAGQTTWTFRLPQTGSVKKFSGGFTTPPCDPDSGSMSYSIDVADVATLSRVLAWTLHFLDSKNWIRHTDWTSFVRARTGVDLRHDRA